MARLRFLLDNSGFDAATLTASSQATGFPASNLHDQFRTRQWRTTGCTSEYVDIDFGEEAYVSGLALVNHNLSVTGAVTVTAGTSIGDDSLLSVGFDAVEPALGVGEGGIGEHGFGGYLTEEEIAKYSTDPVAIYYFPGTSARYWRVAFQDADNSEGYIAVGRMILCEVLDSSRLPSQGVRFVPVDETHRRTKRSLGGQKWSNRQPRYRRLEINLQYIPPTSVWWDIVAMLREVGTSWDFVTDYALEAGGDEQSMDFWVGCIYGRLVNNEGVSLTNPHYGHARMIIEESL